MANRGDTISDSERKVILRNVRAAEALLMSRISDLESGINLPVAADDRKKMEAAAGLAAKMGEKESILISKASGELTSGDLESCRHGLALVRAALVLMGADFGPGYAKAYTKKFRGRKNDAGDLTYDWYRDPAREGRSCCCKCDAVVGGCDGVGFRSENDAKKAHKALEEIERAEPLT